MDTYKLFMVQYASISKEREGEQKIINEIMIGNRFETEYSNFEGTGVINSPGHCSSCRSDDQHCYLVILTFH